MVSGEEVRQMKVAVIGAGKMGLPLACQFAHMGAKVIACDLRDSVVDAINKGQCPIDEPGLSELLSEVVGSGKLSATTETVRAVAESEVVVVIVPVLLTRDHHADLTAVEEVSSQIAQGLRPGMMVSYETTVPVGTTRERLRPLLEKSGLKAGVDFDLLYSPERVKSHYVLQFLRKNPKVVGGITTAARERGAEFYSQYLGAPVIKADSLEAAELTKLAGMIYRDVNIALSNELSRYAERKGIALPSVIESANTDGEAGILMPGIGVGGHCTPVYPYFLIDDAESQGVPVQLAVLSRQINDGQAKWAIERLRRALGTLDGRRVLILGLAFRPGVKEHLLSPAYLLDSELRLHGAETYVNDPLYSDEEIRSCQLQPGSLDDEQGFDALVLNTAHTEYAELNWAVMANRGVQAVIDGRGQWSSELVRNAGVLYLGVGSAAQSDLIPTLSQVPITRPLIGFQEIAAASRVIRSRWLTQGAEVAAFEKDFSVYVGSPNACAVSSCTAALHLALLAVGVEPGDEIITVSHSFVATANSIRYCGATPVFVDIDPETFNIDPEKIEVAISQKTRAILCVHQMGMPCDLASILDIAHKHNLPVVEDAACAIGSEIQWQNEWQKIGKPHGDIACFSFHPRKLVTTGDGGMLTTANPEYDHQFRLRRQHCMNISDSARHQASDVAFESYIDLGFNYRLTDIQAAIGREQLRRLPEIIKTRRSLAQRYHEMLSDIDGLKLPHEPDWGRSNWQSYCVRLPEELDQRQVMRSMLNSGVATRRGVMCAHRELAYPRGTWSCGNISCGSFQEPCSHLRASERAQDHCIILPMFHDMCETQQRTVVGALQNAVRTQRPRVYKTESQLLPVSGSEESA